MQSVAELCVALRTPKKLVAINDWKKVNKTLRLTASLGADDVVLPGVSFMANTNVDRPDEAVALMLHTTVRQKSRCFARVDWRGTQHGNHHALCGKFQWDDAGRTHFHDTEMYNGIDFKELFGGSLELPIARAIIPEPPDYAKLLEISAELLHISNLGNIPVPPWSPQASYI